MIVRREVWKVGITYERKGRGLTIVFKSSRFKGLLVGAKAGFGVLGELDRCITAFLASE